MTDPVEHGAPGRPPGELPARPARPRAVAWLLNGMYIVALLAGLTTVVLWLFFSALAADWPFITILALSWLAAVTATAASGLSLWRPERGDVVYATLMFGWALIMWGGVWLSTIFVGFLELG